MLLVFVFSEMSITLLKAFFKCCSVSPLVAVILNGPLQFFKFFINSNPPAGDGTTVLQLGLIKTLIRGSLGQQQSILGG